MIRLVEWIVLSSIFNNMLSSIFNNMSQILNKKQQTYFVETTLRNNLDIIGLS